MTVPRQLVALRALNGSAGGWAAPRAHRRDGFAADPDPALLGVTVADVLGAVDELTESDITALI
jgi:hypothetical protein